jgi:hypothetical protein
MADDLFSFVFDKQAADTKLTALPLRKLVMALLLRRPPEPAWEGSEIFSGNTPLDPHQTRCVGTRGPAAEALQLRLLETLEALDIPVLEVYEGGPAATEMIATVKDGAWVEL